MPSTTKENYLKALYFLHQKDQSISLSALGKAMEVSKPTVNDMVKKLQSKGWVDYEKYKPIKLTRKGQREAALIIRKHRLAEMFLVQIMGFGWEEVHDIAEELEHIKSEQLFDRMDELMGFPKVDPHGSVIPNKDGDTHAQNFWVLAQLDTPQTVTLKALRDSSKAFLVYLNKMNLHLGATIVIHSIEPFDNSIQVSYEGHEKESLSQSVTSRLLVAKQRD